MFMWDCKNYTFAFRRDSLTTIMKLFNEKKNQPIMRSQGFAVSTRLKLPHCDTQL